MKIIQTGSPFEVVFLCYIFSNLQVIFPATDAFLHRPTCILSTKNIRSNLPLRYSLHNQKRWQKLPNPRIGFTTQIYRHSTNLYAFPFEILKNQNRSSGIIKILRRNKKTPPSLSGEVLGSLGRPYGILRKKRRSTTCSYSTSSDAPRYLSSLDGNKTEDSVVQNLREDDEFVAAIQEVRDAAQNATSSPGEFTKKIVTNGPNIILRLMLAFVSVELREDFKRRSQHYKSDWTDAFENKRKCIPAILFLYFACLAPVVSFGTISSQITEGAIGVTEFFLASGSAGMAYSVLCGQPMAFIAPTGLTLAFISGLFRFCSLRNIPFLPIYTWVGLWTGFFTMSLGLRGASKWIRYCTRFTDEVFNGLLSFNFIYEACSSLRRNFLLADPNNLSMPFISLSMALGTFWSTMKIISLQTSKYFNQKIRDIAKDFGPAAIIFVFAALNNMPWLKKFQVPTLVVPNTFELAGGRELLIPFLSTSIQTRLLCALPALLLTSLFYMDQNISVRVVNNPDNELKKGTGYNIDMLALGLITCVLSIFGLPWMCGATVQSMNHVKAMTTMKYREITQTSEVDKVVETRTTGFIIHALIAGTVLLLPKLRYLPIPVVSGVFLFLGRKLMTGNTFFGRILDAFAEKKRLPKDHPIHVLGRKKMNMFTSIQIFCLAALWAFKQNSSTAIFFPSVIGMLMTIRSFILPLIYSEKELIALGDPEPE